MEYLKGIRITDDNVRWIVEDLMEAYAGDVWNYVFLLTRDRGAADDLTQEVFLSALRGLRRFEGRSAPKTWLLAIARNASLNWLKSSFVRRVRLVGFVRPTASQRSAEQEALEKMGIRAIWRSVMKLPAKQREVLMLDAHHGLSYAEIARVLDVSEGTVKSRLHRARARMEILLKEEGADS